MSTAKELPAKLPLIRRKQVVLGKLGPYDLDNSTDVLGSTAETPVNTEVQLQTLIVNSSQEMAKEITLQLMLSMPGCSIMYAPSIQIAKWIIKRRKIDLIVSSTILPDGSVDVLKTSLDSLENPPDIIVVGDGKQISRSKTLSKYHLVSSRSMQNESLQAVGNKKRPMITQTVKTLGEDIRNDLNNPLQEIVAMVFVARSGKAADTTEKALEIIDSVAKKMSTIVNSLEEKILKCIG